MKKIMISAVLLAGLVSSAAAQSNFNPRFPQCPDVFDGRSTIQITGVVIGLGGQGPSLQADVELTGKVRIQATCVRYKPNGAVGEVAQSKDFFRPFKSPRIPRLIFDVDVNGGALNFRHETERYSFTDADAALYCPSKGKNWKLEDEKVFLSQWKVTVTRSPYSPTVVDENVQLDALCPNYNPRMID